MRHFLDYRRTFANSAVVGLAIAALTLLGLPPRLIAQTSGTGSIVGTISDSSGAVVVGATVAAVSADTGVKTTSISTGSGRFVIPLLQPGIYSVSITAPGFEALMQEHVVVAALAEVPLNPRLSVGSASQTVIVTDEAPPLQTEDLKLGSNISNETYDALPLAQNQSARDPSAFIGLAVGVSSFSVQPAGPSTASFNGGQTYQNETYVEGLPMTSAGTESDTRNLAFGISVEAVEQFQVAVTGSEATYEGQGISNFIVKAGTGKFHGGVYEFFRNTVFDAKSFFSTNRTVEHQNEFGANISGPILSKKLFFFANYDGYRYAAATLPALQNIPTIAARTGDFSAYFSPGAPGCGVGTAPACVPTGQIFDPTLCLATNASGACTSRQQFSCNGVLNVICPSRLSAVSQSFQSYLPTTNYNGTPLGSGVTGNYTASLPNDVTNDSGTTKVDYDFSAAHRLYGIFSRGKYANPLVGSLAGATATTNSTLPVPYTDGRGVIEYATLAQAHEAWTIAPSLLNDFGFGVSRLYIPLTSNTAGGNYPSKAGLTGLPPGIASTGFPDITFGGTTNVPVSWDGTNSHAFNEYQTTFTLQNNVLWTKGKHQLTFGYQWQALQDNENTPLTGTLAGFTFAQQETGNFNSGGSIISTTGLSYASYLLGLVDSSTVVQNAVIETGGRYKTDAAYIQDNIQINPNLTLNVGLRWDIWSPFTEVENRMSFFNPNIPNPVAGGHLGGLQFAGHGADSCACNTPVKTHHHELGPRFGLAYKINNTTVLRAAYDIFYAHAGGVGGRTNGRQGLSQIGFNSSGSLGSTVTGQPAYNWNAGVPGNPINPPFINPSYGIGFILASTPGAAAIGAGPSTAQTLAYGDPAKGAQAPQYQDFFFNIQHSFGPNTALSLAYSGSVGRYLPGAAVAGQFTNQVPLQNLPLGNVAVGNLLTQPYNAANVATAATLGIAVPNPFPGFTGTIAQALKPYPQYNSISNPWLDVGKSSYNSFQTTLNRRIANGLTYMINYTYSKEMDDLAGVRLPGADYLEYSVGSLDRKHVLASTVVYKLPFGEGRMFNPANPILRAVATGWQVSGIFTVSTGAPLSVGATCNGASVIDAACYPNVVPGIGATLGSKPTTQAEAATAHLNSAAFVNPAIYTYGNAARTAPDGLFAPRNQNLDANVRREIPIFEAVKFVIQADAFNLENEVHFAAPNTTLSSSNYGFYTGQANSPRKFQMSARLSF